MPQNPPSFTFQADLKLFPQHSSLQLRGTLSVSLLQAFLILGCTAPGSGSQCQAVHASRWSWQTIVPAPPSLPRNHSASPEHHKYPPSVSRCHPAASQYCSASYDLSLARAPKASLDLQAVSLQHHLRWCTSPRQSPRPTSVSLDHGSAFSQHGLIITQHLPNVAKSHPASP